MRKLTACILSLVFILSCLGGCSNNADERTLDNFKTAFTEQGLTLEGEDVPFYQLIGASDGTMFYIDKNAVKIYEYESAKKLEDAKGEFTVIAEFISNGKFLLETSSPEAITIFEKSNTKYICGRCSYEDVYDTILGGNGKRLTSWTF